MSHQKNLNVHLLFASTLEKIAICQWLLSLWEMFPAELPRQVGRVVWLRCDDTAKALLRSIKKLRDSDPWEYQLSGEDRVRFRRRDGLGTLVIQLPPMLAEWGLDSHSDDDCLSAINAYQGLFGVDVIYNPSGTGLRALRADYARNGRSERLAPPKKTLEPFKTHGPQALTWIRPLADDEKGRRWLAAFDKSASYLRASDVYCGVGDYDWCRTVDCASLDVRWASQQPGVWRLGGPPVQFHGLEIQLENRWFYTPMLKWLAATTDLFYVLEGYYFSERAQIFRRWREKMLPIADGDKCALRSMCKATYTRSFGLLCSEFLAKQNDQLYRPDWRGQVIEEAAARMLWNIEKVYQALKLSPVAIYDDCLFYAIDDMRLAGLMVGASGFLPQFKVKGVYDLSAALDAGLFNDTIQTFITREWSDSDARGIEYFRVGGDEQ